MSAAIVCYDDLWWPLDDEAARPVILRDCAPAITALLPHIIGRETILQAGANVGVYALALREHFKHIITAEPDPTNYECLKRNLEGRDPDGRITALHAAFGETLTNCAPLVVQDRNCGAHRVAFGTGTIPVWTVDELDLDSLDCLWLDLEGSELFALRGAKHSIAKFEPTICIEDKGLDAQFFGIKPGTVQAFLADLGYTEVARIHRDKVFRRTA